MPGQARILAPFSAPLNQKIIYSFEDSTQPAFQTKVNILHFNPLHMNYQFLGYVPVLIKILDKYSGNLDKTIFFFGKLKSQPLQASDFDKRK